MIGVVGASLLTLRRRRALLWWSLVLTVGTMLAALVILVVLHAVNPEHHGPAGGTSKFAGLMFLLSLLATLAGVLVGGTAGSIDRGSRVFGDLVATGRPRAQLYLARLPAALALLVPMVAAGSVVAVAGCFALAGGTETPTGWEVVSYVVFVLVSGAATCVIAIGVTEVVGSRGIAVGVLLGWFLALEHILASLDVLGRARDGLVGSSYDRLRPLLVADETHELRMSLATAVTVIVAWVVVASLAGLRRAATRDA